MPQGSLIIGVDLAPIKAIPRAITFQSDITTDKCRATIRGHLKTWKADTVLHDGAPNVGTAWVQDAFSQAELVLQSLKLATEFLAPGGTFVTKVFRSKDYNALLWVFNQLFAKVEATKPPSSRNVSAEIFVVCRDFKAPKRIDPKFLDPRSVFAELADPTPNNEARVFNPEKKKRRREGYEEGNYTQFKVVPASEFIQTTDPIAILGQTNKLSFEQTGNGDIALAALDKMPETTIEIRQHCADLKVLGRKEFRALLKWRMKAREIFGFASKKDKKEDDAAEVAEITPMDEELRIQEEMEEMNDKNMGRRKRERRKENERKQKEIIRMQLHMIVPTEIGMEQAGPDGRDSVFAIKSVQRADAVDKIAKGRMATVRPVRAEEESESDVDSDPEEDALDRELDAMFEKYQERKSDSDANYRAKKARREDPDGEWSGFSGSEKAESEVEEDLDSAEEESDDGVPSQTAKPKGPTDGTLSRKAQLFYKSDPIFDEIGPIDAGGDDDSAIDLKADDEDFEGRDESEKPNTSQVSAKLEKLKRPSVETDETKPGFEVVNTDLSDWDKQAELDQNGKLDINIITAEAMTLAQAVASGQKTTQDLVDDNFNKFALRDVDGLPEWFLDDENRHSRQQRPITAAAAAAIKEKLRVLNARPIKKVREAKDRKKFRAAQRLEKLKKKSAMMIDEEGLTERDKAQNIAKMISKAGKKKPKPKVALVIARHGNRGVQGRPRGVKGKYKVVDSRLKKDVRADKRLAKKKK